MSREMLNECMSGQVRSGFHGLCITAMTAEVVCGVDFPDDWYIDYKKMDWADFAEQYLRPGMMALVNNLEEMIRVEINKMLGEKEGRRETTQGLQVSNSAREPGQEGLIQHSQGPAASSPGNPGRPEDRGQESEGSSPQQEKV